MAHPVPDGHNHDTTTPVDRGKAFWAELEQGSEFRQSRATEADLEIRQCNQGG